jgi:deoxyadenosine/deoxycytidine kinase
VADLLGADLLIEGTANHPFLEQIYASSQGRDDLTIELGFLLVHANPWRRIRDGSLTVTDFSPVKDVLFAEEVLSEDDLDLFNSLYSHLFSPKPRPDIAVYLRLDPELCLRRVQSRMQDNPGRSFEQRLSLERLRRLATRYDAASGRLGDKVLTVDVQDGQSADEVAGDVAAAVRAGLASPP